MRKLESLGYFATLFAYYQNYCIRSNQILCNKSAHRGWSKYAPNKSKIATAAILEKR